MDAEGLEAAPVLTSGAMGSASGAADPQENLADDPESVADEPPALETADAVPPPSPEKG
jgi:hypothetical protein